jgi:hypothetical protein
MVERGQWGQDRITNYPGYLTTVLADRGVQWLQEKRGRPLFLYVGLMAPHPPLSGPASPPFGSARPQVAFLGNPDPE